MVHLLFHFKKPDGDFEGRMAGHFDLLLPAKDKYTSGLTLPQLVSCKNIYIYIYMCRWFLHQQPLILCVLTVTIPGPGDV